MDALLQDVRFGLRQLARQRGSSLVAILTLALGIGASTAISSVVDATLLRPLPYPDPEQLFRISVERVEPDGRISRPTPSMEDMRAWQAAGVFTHVAGWGRAFRGRIADGPQPERIEVLHLTEDYLSMHGIAPILGRGVMRADTEFGAPLVALLSYGYWQSRFGGRADVLGQTIRLDADAATIVGVLPATFRAASAVAIPLQIASAEFARRGTGRVSVYARLRPDVTVEQAQARLSTSMSEPPRPDGTARQVRAALTSRLDSALSQYGPTVKVLGGAVGLILLIACVNVAGLLLARGAARQSELLVRASLGAGRGRLMRQLLVESVVLAVPGGLIGLLLAWLSLDVIVANVPLALPPDSPVTLNGLVLVAALGVLLATAVLSGLVPALRLSRVRSATALVRGARQVGSPLSRRGGQWLIAAEISLAVVLVAGAGLMIRSFMRMAAVDLGFQPDNLVTMEVLPLDRNAAAHTAYYGALLQQVRTVRGVSAAGLVDNFVLGSGTSFSSVSAGEKSAGVSVFQVLPGYFETIDARLRSGRFPGVADGADGRRGVILGQSAALALFPNQAAVGKTIVRAGADATPWTVVGVIDDLRHGGPLETMMRQPQVFFPLQPTDFSLNQAMTIVMRTSAGHAALAEQLRDVARSLGPRVMVERIRSADDWFDERVITPRRRTVLLSLLGGLGLTLALVGVFAMTGYAVTRRTAEIGVRMAFGARPWQVVRTMLRDAVVPTVAGTVAGVVLSLAATRVIASFLFEIAATDPVTLAAVAITLTATGTMAALVPALRAATVDPASTLRAE
jgi:predicted permease